MAEKLNLPGCKVPPLPKGWNPYEALVVFKCLDEVGDTRICYRVSEGWTTWEAMGAVTGMLDMMRQDFQQSLGSPQSDPEEPE